LVALVVNVEAGFIKNPPGDLIGSSNVGSQYHPLNQAGFTAHAGGGESFGLIIKEGDEPVVFTGHDWGGF
jgi:hypothetical protein